jgi:hypothetical protein
VECSEDNLQLEQWIRVRPETVGQFINKTDDNNKDIYEDDIVKDVYGRKLQVVFNNYKWQFKALDGKTTFSYADVWEWESADLEIIGNIHEIKKGE